MADRTLEIQKAVVAALLADNGVSALVGPRVYDRPPANVVLPYIRLESVVRAPFDAQDLRGSDLVLRINTYSRAIGRVECRRILAAMNDALHFSNLSLDAGQSVYARVSGSRDFEDADGVTTVGVIDLSVITDG